MHFTAVNLPDSKTLHI